MTRWFRETGKKRRRTPESKWRLRRRSWDSHSDPVSREKRAWPIQLHVARRRDESTTTTTTTTTATAGTGSLREEVVQDAEKNEERKVSSIAVD